MEQQKNNGYFVMTFGAGKYQSVAWYKDKIAAQLEVKRRLLMGSWSGMPPKIEATRSQTQWNN